MASVGLTRFTLLILYGTYLAYAGLFFLVAPWTELWTLLVIRLPALPAVVLGNPAVRGMISAFGLLHFGLAALESVRGLRRPAQPSRSTDRTVPPAP